MTWVTGLNAWNTDDFTSWMWQLKNSIYLFIFNELKYNTIQKFRVGMMF